MFKNQSEFYKSKKWQAFREIIIDRDTKSDGFVYCAHCMKPILNKYDLIVHHLKELSADNVNDYSISLDPDNVVCVHFKCHNQIHDRFTGGSKYGEYNKRVYIVYGAPCSGKSTWVNDVASSTDLIVDLDSIYQMISNNDRYIKPDSLRSVVFNLRDSLYNVIKYRNGKWGSAYIITGGARIGDRERLKKRVSADELIFIDTDKDICLQRAKERSKEWITYVNDWFESYQE